MRLKLAVETFRSAKLHWSATWLCHRKDFKCRIRLANTFVKQALNSGLTRFRHSFTLPTLARPRLLSNSLPSTDYNKIIRFSFAELIAQNNKTLIFPQDIVIDDQSRKLYVLANNLPKFQRGSFDPSETNFFITSGDLDELAMLCKDNAGYADYDETRQSDIVIFPDTYL